MRLLILILFLTISLSFLNADDNGVYSFIEEEDFSSLDEYLLSNDINLVLQESNTTLLVYSIQKGKRGVCKYLIENAADVNLFARGMSPLMHASAEADIRIMKQLISAGADINARDSLGNTPLFLAAGYGVEKTCKVLLKNGAYLNHTNLEMKTAYDYAVSKNNIITSQYLRGHYEKNLPDFRDGPYVKWNSSSRIKSFYFVHDSVSRITRKQKMKFRAISDTCLMDGFAGDTLEYPLVKAKNIPADRYSGIDKILVMGDVHGGYDSLLVLLVNNGIINNRLQWTWGKGHVVFLGDIFDRGNKVTEALWLIYRLEEQARASGGAVHYILGNHEVMVLQKKHDYVADKYLLLNNKLNTEYGDLFNKRTLLGQWLRTKNTIMQIDDKLFVHAGLSPSISFSGLSISDINETVRYFLNHPDRDHDGDKTRLQIMGSWGPFWYRGFIEDNHYYEHLPEEDFSRVLSTFNAGQIFIGHTRMDKITPLYDSRVFALDVPYYSNSHNIQALLIEKHAIFLVNTSGSKEQIR